MKKLFALPVIGLILGAVAIATELKTSDLIPLGQQLSGTTITCISTALEKREITMITILSLYQNDKISILTTRKTALLAALGQTTKAEIKTAISAAWKVYKNSLSASTANLHTAKNLAWKTYKDEVKACKGFSLLQNIDMSSVRDED